MNPTPVVPDFVTVAEFVTFTGCSISDALRKAADWLDQEGLSESEDVGPIQIGNPTYETADQTWRVSLIGHTRNGKSFGDFNIANLRNLP
jgi:hypothetical protein